MFKCIFSLALVLVSSPSKSLKPKLQILHHKILHPDVQAKENLDKFILTRAMVIYSNKNKI